MDFFHGGRFDRLGESHMKRKNRKNFVRIIALRQWGQIGVNFDSESGIVSLLKVPVADCISESDCFPFAHFL